MELRKYPNHRTMSVYVEGGARGNGSSEVPDLVVRGDQRPDEEGAADDSKVEGEKESYECEESHSGGGGGTGDGLTGAPHVRSTLCVCGCRNQGETGVTPFVGHDSICNAGTSINVCNFTLRRPQLATLPEAK